jgi:hypothetical protein
MFGLQWLRNKLDSKAHNYLSSHEGNLLLIKKNGDDATLVSASVKRARYMLGFIPLYRVSSDRLKISLAQDIIKPIAELTQALQKVVKNYPQTVWKMIVEHMAKHLYGGLDSIRGQTVARITSSYSAFHKKFLADLISKNQNAYRQKLSEVLKTTAGETLTNSIRKHLGMLLVKIREEEQKRSHQDYASSGPFALPSSCKFIFKKENVTVFIIEQSPQVRTISYLGTRFQIALPYVIFVATVRQSDFLWLQVFFRTSPLQYEADELLCPALPNVRADYTICFPEPKNRNATPGQVAEEAIQNYWGSNFNKDLQAFFNSAASQFVQLRSFEEWQNQSKADSQFVLKLAWQSAKVSVNHLAGNMLNDALKVDDKPPEKSSADMLQEYAETLGDKFSREIAEKIHFMVSHSRVDVDSLASANEQLVKLIETTVQELKAKVEKLLATPIDNAELESICQHVQQELNTEMERVCSHPIVEATSKIKQLQ